MCDLACPYGFASGSDGCLVCQCLPDPRPCSGLTVEQCRSTERCAAVTFDDRAQCCSRAGDGTIECSAPPPPASCLSDVECLPGQTCNTMDYCDPAPGCSRDEACPAVCYGRCVSGGGGEYCAGDYECGLNEHCVYAADAAPCPDDPNSGSCEQRYLGMCEPVACPEIAQLCPDGSTPTSYMEQPHGCPVPICDGTCEGLPPEQCEVRTDCEAVYGGGGCACDCDPTSSDVPCEMCDCAPVDFQCVSRPVCYSDTDCGPEEYCDYNYMDPSTGSGDRAVMQGRCIRSATYCEGLDEVTCTQTPECYPIYGDACPPCGRDDPSGGACAPCYSGFIGCKPNDVWHCSRDYDCGPGYRCNTCPSDPRCPMCDVCGPPVCEPAPVERCMVDADCGFERFCRIEACSDNGVCTGVCEGFPTGCANLDEASCASSPSCRAIYTGASCNDGCHDADGRLTSCGPCMDIACFPGVYSHCEDAPWRQCCSDLECSAGETCQFNRNINIGECAPDITRCGGSQSGWCPSGSECHWVGCDATCGGGSGGSPVPPDEGSGVMCCPFYECVALNGCTSDAECGPGMFCNTCPSACMDGDVNCTTECGAPRCETFPGGNCRVDEDCPMGCACQGAATDPGGVITNGMCTSPDGADCNGNTFRVCTDDSQCLPDEYCQRCPPGAACFVADHCAPRERPYRACSSDSECLTDEHCGTTCTDSTACDQAPHCVPGAPGLRWCSSNLECRPDEYCQKCPPGAMCLVADHCAVRTFRTCTADAECLADEYCSTCPSGVQCLVYIAPHCEVRPFRVCSADTDCNNGEHCEKCPPGAQCLVADHCVPNR